MTQSHIALIPPDAVITGKYIDPANENKIVVEYLYEGSLIRVSPERLDISDFITYKNNNIYLIDGLTYNDLYQIYSDRFNLGFIKGEDFLDNSELVENTGRVYLETNPLSTRFNPETITIDIVKSEYIFNGTEEQRNLLGKDINPFTNKLFNGLRSLSTTLFDGTEITCFEKYILSIEFRNIITATIPITEDELISEVKSSYAISAFNDGVSDILIMLGPNQIPYAIRYVSKDGDIPVFD